MAPQIISGIDAEKLLNFSDLKTFPQSLNHFDLIKADGSIDLEKDALKSIREYIVKEDQVEGRKLLEHFDEAPYGWSKDTTRFLVATMFIASDIKLRISGDDIKVKGPKAIEALKNVNGFNKIGISTYQANEKPSMEMLALSIKRLAELTGESVAPLQDKIAEVVRRHFPEFQAKYSSIKTRLEYLKLPGQEKALEVQEGIAEVLKGEGSDAAFRLGKSDSSLFDNLIWIANVYKGFEQGMESDFKEANTLKESIDALPDSGIPKELKVNTEIDFSTVQEITNDSEFVNRASDLKDAISNIKTLCSDYCQKLLTSENEKIEFEIYQISTSDDWKKLSSVQIEELSDKMNALVIQNMQGIEGIKEILKLNFSIFETLKSVREQITEWIEEKPLPPLPPLPPTPKEGSKKIIKDLSGLSKSITSVDELQKIIETLDAMKSDLIAGNEIEINW